MPCESCSVQFSVFKRKHSCRECGRFYCTSCLRRGGGTMCGACRILSARPLGRQSIIHLRVRDLQCYLHRQNVSTRGCVEKEELVNLVIAHVNSGAYRRRPTQEFPEFANAFNSLKGITSNINSFINSALDLGTHCNDRINTMRNKTNTNQESRTTSQSPPPVPPVNRSDSTNNCHPSTSGINSHSYDEQTSSRRNIALNPRTPNTVENRESTPSVTDTPEIVIQAPNSRIIVDGVETQTPEDNLQDTTDCLEIEDLDDAAEWEFINRPADPLPHNSGLLLTEESATLTDRAASELDLRSSESNESITDTSSLKDETTLLTHNKVTRIQLHDISDMSQIENLNVKQLKELLILNRVDFKGCVERNELMERAKRLYRENAKSREELDRLALDDLCKICMDAPIECVMLECGHIATCTSCGKRLSECPICRQYIVRVVRFFRS